MKKEIDITKIDGKVWKGFWKKNQKIFTYFVYNVSIDEITRKFSSIKQTKNETR